MEEVAAKAGKAPPRALELAAALPALCRQSLTRNNKTQTTARTAQWARECRDLVGASVTGSASVVVLIDGPRSAPVVDRAGHYAGQRSALHQTSVGVRMGSESSGRRMIMAFLGVLVTGPHAAPWSTMYVVSAHDSMRHVYRRCTVLVDGCGIRRSGALDGKCSLLLS